MMLTVKQLFEVKKKTNVEVVALTVQNADLIPKRNLRKIVFYNHGTKKMMIVTYLLQKLLEEWNRIRNC